MRRGGDGRFDGGNDRVLEITGGSPHTPGYREDRYPLGLDLAGDRPLSPEGWPCPRRPPRGHDTRED